MFRDNDVICFLGDSITANGLYIAEVYQTLRKKYKIKCYNCGVAGGISRKAAEYLHSYCLIHNPDYVVIMFGINDIARWVFSEEHKNNPDKISILTNAKKAHIESYEKIIQDVKASGAQPIICVTVPYDELSDSPAENLRCQSVLDELTVMHRELAAKYDCPIVDFKKAMQPLLPEGIINSDRVHPTNRGYHIMAQTFLYDTGEIEKCDFDSAFVFEDWNKERFDAENRLHGLNFVEFCALYDECWAKNMPTDKKKELARARYEEFRDKSTFVPQAYFDYIENIDFMDKLRGEVVKKTFF